MPSQGLYLQDTENCHKTFFTENSHVWYWRAVDSAYSWYGELVIWSRFVELFPKPLKRQFGEKIDQECILRSQRFYFKISTKGYLGQSWRLLASLIAGESFFQVKDRKGYRNCLRDLCRTDLYKKYGKPISLVCHFYINIFLWRPKLSYDAHGVSS